MQYVKYLAEGLRFEPVTIELRPIPLSNLVWVMVAGMTAGWMAGRRETAGKVGRAGTTRVALQQERRPSANYFFLLFLLGHSFQSQ